MRGRYDSFAHLLQCRKAMISRVGLSCFQKPMKEAELLH